MEFIKFQKIPRLSRQCIITEKIDGTNACIYIGPPDALSIYQSGSMALWAGSKNRWITPENDNFGFAKWAKANADKLMLLGPGVHHGEWWGQGIQRGYGLREKRFSLFNTSKWSDNTIRPTCCHVVPIILSGVFSTFGTETALEILRKSGSLASPGFMKPEGIVIFHVAGNLMFKKTIEQDNEPKGG